MIDKKRIKGKNIAITGATKGIGRAAALLLSELGANLLIGSRTLQHSVNTSAELNTKKVEANLDVTDEASIKNFLISGLDELGSIDALINCAGYGNFESAFELSTEDFDRMISVNLRGTFLTCKHFGNHMIESKSGKILNIISIAGSNALAGCAGYSASKFGALGLSRVLQMEMRGTGVQLTSVLPGAVNTEFWDHMNQVPDRSKMIPPETIAEHLVYLLCQPDGATVDEVTIMPPMGVL
ncbi:SDR family oxidoreductase [Bacillus massiliglaciei]|uniref:SDR family oxidoreductase n=1 Tax=Bacillus massiliglaciei TaxID=1816693 RepID=UPI000DA61F97|nr:SDR family oxidoreductase [Bacillus massiliglaciei]